VGFSIHRASRRFPCQPQEGQRCWLPGRLWRLGNGLTGMAPILPKNQTHDDCQSFDTCRNPATAVTSLGSTGWPGEPQNTWQPVDANGVRYADGSSPASQRRRSLQDQAHLRVSISGLAVRLAQPPTGARCSHFPLQAVCQGCESYETGGETTLFQAVLLARLPCKRERGCRIGMHFLLFCLAVEPNQPGDNRK
jgi:hypothetical protein